MKFIKKLLKWVCTIISIGLIYQGFFGDENIQWELLVGGALFLIPWLITKFDNEYNMSEVLSKYIYLKENKVNAKGPKVEVPKAEDLVKEKVDVEK